MTDVQPVDRDLVPPRAVASRALALAAAVAGALTLGACSGVDAPLPSQAGASALASVPAPELTATVAFPRPLQADRWVEVLVTGTADDEWRVTSAAIDSPYFSTAAAIDRNVRLFDGADAHVKVPLGVATCPADASVPSVAHLALVHDAGDTASVDVAVPGEVLAGINTVECAARAVTDIAMPSLGEPTDAQGTVVTASLILSRGDASPESTVSVTDVRGSIIFEMAPAVAGDLPLTLAPGEADVSIGLQFEASRCDDHAFAESKKTFVFPVWLSVDGAEPLYYELQPEATLKQALQEAFDTCGEN